MATSPSPYEIQLLNAIAWHHLAFIFLSAFIFGFRKQISELIERIRKIGKEGVLVDSPLEKQQEKIDTNTNLTDKVLAELGNSAVLEKNKTQIQEELERLDLVNEDDKVQLLAERLAWTQLLLQFEQIYAVIFGSQIKLLDKLNEAHKQGISISEVSTYINDVRRSYPDTLGKWHDEQYLNYLISSSLIAKDGSRYKITNVGTEFLIWMARHRRDRNKRL